MIILIQSSIWITSAMMYNAQKKHQKTLNAILPIKSPQAVQTRLRHPDKNNTGMWSH